MGGVPCASSVIQEEGLVWRVDMGILDELDGLISQVNVQVIAFLRRSRHGNRVVVVGQVGEVLIGVATQEAVVAFKATAQRPAMERTGGGGFFRGSQVPLADSKCVVPMFQQHLRDETVFKAHIAVVCRIADGDLGDGRQSQCVVVAPGQHTAAGGRTEGCCVEVGLAQAPIR